MQGAVSYFNRFLIKKITKREFSGRFSGKVPCYRATNFPTCNGFILNAAVPLAIGIRKPQFSKRNPPTQNDIYFRVEENFPSNILKSGYPCCVVSALVERLICVGRMS